MGLYDSRKKKLSHHILRTVVRDQLGSVFACVHFYPNISQINMSNSAKSVLMFMCVAVCNCQVLLISQMLWNEKFCLCAPSFTIASIFCSPYVRDIVQSLQIGRPLFCTGCVSTKVEHRRQWTVSLRCVCVGVRCWKSILPRTDCHVKAVRTLYTQYSFLGSSYSTHRSVHTCVRAHTQSARWIASCHSVLWVGRDGGSFHAASWMPSYF